MRTLHSILLLPLGLIACNEAASPYGPSRSEVGYSDRIYADRVVAGQLDRADDGETLLRARAGDPGFAEAVEIAEGEAVIRRGAREPGLLALQRARREGGLARQRHLAGRAGRDLEQAGRARAEAARELSRAEWLDRRPVGTDAFDSEDFRRRQEALELGRAAGVEARAALEAGRARARLDLLEREARIRERIDRIDRMERRQQARERLLATRSDADAELRRLLPYRRTGESIDAFRDRVERARGLSGRTGAPVERLLQD